MPDLQISPEPTDEEKQLRTSVLFAEATAHAEQLSKTVLTMPHQAGEDGRLFGSVTTLRPELVGDEETRRIHASLGLEPELDGEPLTVLRHTLMNPYLIDQENGISYIERYFEFLARCGAQLART